MPRIFMPSVTPGNNALLASDSQKKRRQQENRATVFDFDDQEDEGESSQQDHQESTTDDSDHNADNVDQSSPDLLHPRNLGVHPACQPSKLGSRRGGVVEESGSVENGGISNLTNSKNTHKSTRPGLLKRDSRSANVPVDKEAMMEEEDHRSQGKRPRLNSDIEVVQPSLRLGVSPIPLSNASKIGAQRENGDAVNTVETAATSPACGGDGEEVGIRIEEAKGVDTQIGRRHETVCGSGYGESGCFTVVFVTQTLGITIAQDDDGSVVVCEREGNIAPHETSAGRDMVGIGDRMVAIGGTKVAGLVISDVERMLVRGPRPLEVEFQRIPRVSNPNGKRRRANEPAAIHHDGVVKLASPGGQPLGGLERPSRDCLLDTISNIATQEDSLAKVQLFDAGQESSHREVAVAGAVDKVGNGFTVSRSRGFAPENKHGDSIPARNAWPISQSESATSSAVAAPPTEARHCDPNSTRTSPASTASCGVAGAQDQSQGGGPHRVLRESFTAAPPDVVGKGTVAGQAEAVFRLIQPLVEDGEKESARGVNDDVSSGVPNTKRSKSKKVSGGSTPAVVSAKRLRDGSISSNVGAGARTDGNNQKAPTAVPSVAEIAHILTKLGSRGVSSLTLYKSLTFDELVRISRYAGVDVSKRLSKATMAERLNSLYVEKGVLRREQRMAATEQSEGGRALANLSTDQATERHRSNELSRLATCSEATVKRATPAQDVSCARPPLPSSFSPPLRLHPHEARVSSPRGCSAWHTPTASTILNDRPVFSPKPRRIPGHLAPILLREASPLHEARPGCNDSRNHPAWGPALATPTPSTPRRTGVTGEDEEQCWEDWNYHDYVAVGRHKRNDEGNEASYWQGESDGDWTACLSPPSAPRSPAWDGHDRSRGKTETSGWRNPLLPSLDSARNTLSIGLAVGEGFSVLPKWILRSVKTIGTQTPAWMM